MKNSHKISILLLLTFLFAGCKDLGLIEIPKYLGDKKWGNPNDGSRFTVVGELKIHYRDEGPEDAPTIVMIHGIADSLHVWDNTVNLLKNDFRIIRFDVPGFGLTGPVPEKEYTPQVWINYLDGLLAKLKVKKAHLMGNSLGGYIAWNFALARPAKVESLFLLDPAAFPVSRAPWVVELARWYPVRQITTATTPRLLVSRAIHEVYGDDSLVTEEIIDRYYEMMLRKDNRHSYMDVFRKILDLKNVYPIELAELETKTMVVFGEEDEWIPPSQLESWQKEVPHVKTNTYPGVGHTPQAESAELVVDDFLEFIK